MTISISEKLLFGTLELTSQVLNTLSDAALYLTEFFYANIDRYSLDTMTCQILTTLLHVLRDLIGEVAANCLPAYSDLTAELIGLSQAVATFIIEDLGGL